MKKIVISIIVIDLIIILLFIGANYSGEDPNNSKLILPEDDILFRTTYYYAMGSERIIIYENGDVYTDMEMESPNHKPNYAKKMTLAEVEVTELKVKLAEENDHDKLKPYINKLIHGDEKFDPFPPIKFNIK